LLLIVWPKKISKPLILSIPGKRGHLGPLGFSKTKIFFLASWQVSADRKGRRVRIVVHGSFAGAFAKDGAPNEAQRGELLGDVGGGD
jgi:hypothetical protein